MLYQSQKSYCCTRVAAAKRENLTKIAVTETQPVKIPKNIKTAKQVLEL